MMSVKNLTLLAGLAAISFAGAANATQLVGSLPLVGFGVNQDSTDLVASSTLTDTFSLTSGVGAGSYLPIPVGANFATTPLTLSNPINFTISNPVYGNFIPTSFVLVSRTTNNYDVELFGDYNPGPGLPGFTTTNGELRISVNQSGTSLSEAITLSTPAFDTPSTPEPGSVAMLIAGGMTGAGFLVRRRRSSK